MDQHLSKACHGPGPVLGIQAAGMSKTWSCPKGAHSSGGRTLTQLTKVSPCDECLAPPQGSGVQSWERLILLGQQRRVRGNQREQMPEAKREVGQAENGGECCRQRERNEQKLRGRTIDYVLQGKTSSYIRASQSTLIHPTSVYEAGAIGQGV